MTMTRCCQGPNISGPCVHLIPKISNIEAAKHEGALDDGAIVEGALDDGALDEGALDDCAIVEGALGDGAIVEGDLGDGAAAKFSRNTSLRN